MDYNDQTDAFTIELTTLINRYINEFDINVTTIIGALEEVKHDLIDKGNFLFEMGDDFFDEDDDELLDD